MVCGSFDFEHKNLIDLSVEFMLRECDILKNNNFLNEYPDISKLAEELHKVVEQSYLEKGCYPPFEKLGIDNVKEYLHLLEWERSDAIEFYHQLYEMDF